MAEILDAAATGRERATSGREDPESLRLTELRLARPAESEACHRPTAPGTGCTSRYRRP